jgi:hypothetical protein
MKKSLYTIPILLFTFYSCKKDSTDNISKTVNVSTPVIKLKGPAQDSIVFIPLGGTFTEAGATFVDDVINVESDLPPVSSVVHTDSVGVYYTTYHATNSNGYEKDRVRVIVVYDPSDTLLDFSGTYYHEQGEYNVQITQGPPRVFLCDDLYGTYSVSIPAYFVQLGSLLYVPIQFINPNLGHEIHGPGEFTGTAGSYTLDFYGLERDGNARPRSMVEQ